FGHYTRLDLITAGMPEETYNKLHDHDYPLPHRWELLRPYLPEIRYGSYARAAFIAARELYRFDDINDDNYQQISLAMQEANQPGVYTWILREKCNIACCLTQCGSTAVDGDLLIPLMPADQLGAVANWQQVQQRAAELECSVNTLDDYVHLMEKGLLRWKEEGAVGIKTRCQPLPDGDRRQAVEAFEALRRGTESGLPGLHPLTTYLLDRLLELCARHEMMVAVHAGMWGDFTTLDCKHMIPVFMRHPETRFDLYHLSFPSVHDAVIIGKNFGNVWLNLCWTHIMSPTLTKEGMREILDFVPVNKVFAFGGDYSSRAVDKAIGHLRLAQDNIACVLAERVEEGVMTEDQALEIARKWFWDNPKEAYGLEV
ncbi:MAG: amidohydrolase family protein, partial [Armatimonadota bacterium]